MIINYKPLMTRSNCVHVVPQTRKTISAKDALGRKARRATVLKDGKRMISPTAQISFFLHHSNQASWQITRICCDVPKLLVNRSNFADMTYSAPVLRITVEVQVESDTIIRYPRKCQGLMTQPSGHKPFINHRLFTSQFLLRGLSTYDIVLLEVGSQLDAIYCGYYPCTTCMFPFQMSPNHMSPPLSIPWKLVMKTLPHIVSLTDTLSPYTLKDEIALKFEIGLRYALLESSDGELNYWLHHRCSSSHLYHAN